MGLNKVILMGNLTRDPELKYTTNGTALANFGIAVNRRFKQGDELKEEVCFLDCTAFSKQAETVAQYCSKGKGVIVEGRLQQRSWETEDGQKRSKYEVVVEQLTFLPKQGVAEAEPEQ